MKWVGVVLTTALAIASIALALHGYTRDSLVMAACTVVNGVCTALWIRRG